MQEVKHAQTASAASTRAELDLLFHATWARFGRRIPREKKSTVLKTLLAVFRSAASPQGIERLAWKIREEWREAAPEQRVETRIAISTADDFAGEADASTLPVENILDEIGDFLLSEPGPVDLSVREQLADVLFSLSLLDADNWLGVSTLPD